MICSSIVSHPLPDSRERAEGEMEDELTGNREPHSRAGSGLVQAVVLQDLGGQGFSQR